MSPLASGKVLPCSDDRSLARSSYSFATNSRNLNITRARRCGLVAAQAGWAAAELAMAFSTSLLLASATLACTSPVLGSKTSPRRPEVPLTVLPPMKWPISRMGLVSSGFSGVRDADLGALGAQLWQFSQLLSDRSRLWRALPGRFSFTNG